MAKKVITKTTRKKKVSHSADVIYDEDGFNILGEDGGGVLEEDGFLEGELEIDAPINAHPKRKLRIIATIFTLVVILIGLGAGLIVYSIKRSADKMAAEFNAIIESSAFSNEDKMLKFVDLMDGRGVDFSGYTLTLKKDFYGRAMREPVKWYNATAISLLQSSPDLTQPEEFLPDLYNKIFSNTDSALKQKYAAMYYEAVKNYPEPHRARPLLKEAELSKDEIDEINAFGVRYAGHLVSLEKVDSSFAINVLAVYKKCNPVGFFAHDFNLYLGQPPFQTDKDLNERRDYLTSGVDAYLGIELLYYTPLFSSSPSTLEAYYKWITRRQPTLADSHLTLINAAEPTEVNSLLVAYCNEYYENYLTFAKENLLEYIKTEKFLRSLEKNSGVSVFHMNLNELSGVLNTKSLDTIENGFTLALKKEDVEKDLLQDDIYVQYEAQNLINKAESLVKSGENNIKYVPLNYARYIIKINYYYEEDVTDGGIILKGKLYLSDRNNMGKWGYEDPVPEEREFRIESKTSKPVLSDILTDSIISALISQIF